MKFQRNRGITWTTLELTGLLEDEDSHVHFTRTTKHLSLHPCHLNNIQRGLNQILRSMLHTYDRELKGFVLQFKNPKLLSNLGDILYDSPFIHVDIEADFYLFRPTIGSFLKGIVNKKGLDYIVMLVHKIYTVSIPKPDNTEEWSGESVEIGQEIKCCVTQIHHKSKLPFICATLRHDYSQGCRLSESISNIDNVDNAIESAISAMKTDPIADGISEDDGISEKEKKKHRKKHKFRESNSEFICKVENESVSNDNVGTSKVKSEKKQQYQSMQNDSVGNDTYRTIKSEKKQQYQTTLLNTDDSDNMSKKHKKSKKASKSLLNNDTILDEHTQSRKAVKRENSISLDSIAETETKEKKKRAKKSKDPEFIFIKTEKEEEIIDNAGNTIFIANDASKTIKSEKKHRTTLLNIDDSLNNSEVDNIPKKHKKSKKTSKSLFNNHTILDGRTESRKVMKRENSISLDSIIEIETKEKKKRAKKSKDPEFMFIKTEDEEVVECNAENTILVGNDTSRTIKSEKEQQYQTTLLNIDDSLNNSEIDNSSKKHKKSKKTSKSLLNNDTILDEYTEARKVVKRENSISLDNIVETETKEKKKLAKKSKNPEFIFIKTEKEEEIIDNAGNTILVGNDTSRAIKSEKEQQYQTTLLNDDFLNNSEVDTSPKKHKKSKKTSKLLFNNDIILDEYTESPEAMKKENSISLDNIAETETQEKKKLAKKSKDPEFMFIKTEKKEKTVDNEENTILVGNTSRTIKSEKEQQYQTTLLNTDNSLNNLEVDNIPKKHKKSKKTSKSLDNDIILDEHTDSRKTVKRENSISLNSFSDTETKKKKKHAKKSEDPEFTFIKTEKEEIIVNTENIIPYIKSEEEQHTPRKHIISNAHSFSSNLEDSVFK